MVGMLREVDCVPAGSCMSGNIHVRLREDKKQTTGRTRANVQWDEVVVENLMMSMGVGCGYGYGVVDMNSSMEGIEFMV
ncbi:hypothetical protein TSUD_67790 [Trifolium subterraneum]|uniref:Uncharacterized protein n=1 Tax=Trifolium subterraneum TaxID=3900 RepID=A0A2Z6NKE3_TRISU|nr:hypothetical protein TSUD_67790 [Trifolium subterraneum]